MQIAASFLEYFVTGVVALAWLALLSPQSWEAIGKLSSGQALLIVPILYCLGMVADGGGRLLTQPFLRRLMGPRKGAETPGGEAGHTFIFYHSPELTRELQSRRTRYRIARGMVFNTVAIALISLVRRPTLFPQVSPVFLWLSLLVGVALTFALWLRFQWLHDRFRENAIETIVKAQSRR